MIWTSRIDILRNQTLVRNGAVSDPDSAIWPRRARWVGDQITVSDLRRSAPGARDPPFGAADGSSSINGHGAP